ncbi:STAS domain-containing protein [Streptomyces sp. N50]|uniref:STAS domain-containing protein n=1 Tax=Streptomyces sp. N50 TaxID=3081765 RepID=UPI002962554A|nr:STAS domain-containing protein [Streptomyces sp. N50]WOX11351.1 STAS domain-containing protein [Streptomyces sp. N50]
MGLRPELIDELRVVRASGELDLVTVPAFAQELKEARHGTGRLFLVVDLLDVTFMDGSVLDPLSAAWEECRGRLGWLRVVHSRPGSLVFRAAGLVGRFPRYASVRDAREGVLADGASERRAT